MLQPTPVHRSTFESCPLRQPWTWTVSQWGVAGFVGFVLFFNLGDCTSFGAHEVLTVVPAQAMLDGGSWLVPEYAGLPRLTKPPLMYWTLAVWGWLCGGLNELTARVPTAVCSLLLAFLVGDRASRWYGNPAGWAAFLVQGSALFAVTYGRTSKMDMPLCLLTTAALFLIVDQPDRTTRWKSFFRWLGIYVLLSLAWMLKFHYGPVMVLAPAAVWFLGQRQPRKLLHLLNPLGLPLFVASVTIWPWLVLQQRPEVGELWRLETVGRALGELPDEPAWFYLPHYLLLLVPWTPFVLAGWPRSWGEAWNEALPLTRSPAQHHEQARERFLWLWMGVQTVILLASQGKHPSYLLAMLPTASLWAARPLAVWPEMLRSVVWMRQGYRWVWLGVMPVGLSGLLILPDAVPPRFSSSVQTLLILTAVSLFVIYICLDHERIATALWLTAALAIGLYMVTMSEVLPRIDHRRQNIEFAAALRRDYGEQEFLACRTGEDPLLYYLRQPVQRVESDQELQQRLEGQPSLLVLVPQAELKLLHQQFTVTPLREQELDPGLRRPDNAPFWLVRVEPRAARAASSDGL